MFLLAVVASLSAHAPTAPTELLLSPRFEELLDIADRPITTYVPIAAPSAPMAKAARAEAQPLFLYMNRHGGAYTCGEEDARQNRSTIACARPTGVAEVSPFDGDDADWEEVMTCLRDLFAPFNLPVTDQEPLEGSYVEAVIGGTPDEAGMEPGVGGVAPFTCNVIDNAVVYDFAEVWQGDLRAVCETAAQEIAHAFGLDHEFLCEDPMTYLYGCGDKAFVDEYVPCGEFEARACECGEPTQNSVQSMLELFGAADGTVVTPPEDTAPPSLAVVTPTDGDLLPANSTVSIVVDASDDVGLTVVELEWDFSGERMFCPAAVDGGSYTCSRDGERYTWKIDVGAGMRTFRAHVRDVAGNERTSEDVSLWFSPDGESPPVDESVPAIVIGAPLPGASMATDVPFDVVATVVDDTGVARVELGWTRFGSQVYLPCPYDDGRFTCVQNGDSYRWTVRSRRAGLRDFTIRATDLLGNVVETDARTVSVEDGATPLAADGNDALDEAAVIGCGDSAAVEPFDVDWFRVEAPAGDTVSISVDRGDARLTATDGATLLAADARTVELPMTEALLAFAVVHASVIDAASTVSVVCIEPVVAPALGEPYDDDGGCSTSAGAPATLALALLAMARRRAGRRGGWRQR